VNPSGIVPAVVGLFFPQSRILGLDVQYDYSPSALRKITYAGTQAVSFPQATRDLQELAEVDLTSERVRRATEMIGRERVEERDAQAAAYESLPIPEQRQAPADRPIPAVACVQMDGGRMQVMDRQHPERNEDNTFWREVKVGCLWSMHSSVSTEDPCPQLPSSFVDPEKMQKLVREIKGFSGPSSDPTDDDDQEKEAHLDEREGRPVPIARSVVATRQPVTQFGKLLEAEAYSRCFMAASRKAFVADGSEANWGVWRRHFSDYVPILDFIHALTYVYAAALAGATLKDGWQTYREWAQKIWSGQVDHVIDALELRQQSLGEPDQETPPTAPLAIVTTTLGYLRNQRSRMNYSEYRRQGLPITSAYVESTVKQINRRMKGSEKFWSCGAEAMLTLVADHLNDTPTLHHFWRNRPNRLSGLREYQRTAA
jgi:hypothetical protein